MREMTVVVMNKKTMTQESVFKGDMRVSKNLKGDKFYVIKNFTDEELELLKPEKEYVCYEYPVADYFLILN